MGEQHTQPFQLSFNASLKVDFQGSQVTSDGGLILVREFDERLGLGEWIDRHLVDRRQGKNTYFPLVELLRQSAYSRLAGYEDVNDAERLAQDPTSRLIGSWFKEWVHTAAAIDAAKIVWAHDMGVADNQELLDYLKDRRFWLAEEDLRPPKLIPYPPQPAAS